MLQQTQVETVIPYYRRFLARFPSVNAVAEARADEVLKLWENLGYYSRARHLHAAAKEIVARWGSRLPQTRKDLMTLPGIGEYTAAAILSIAFGQCVTAIDGNVSRVISRLFALRKPLGFFRIPATDPRSGGSPPEQKASWSLQSGDDGPGRHRVHAANSCMPVVSFEGSLQSKRAGITGTASCCQKKAHPFPQAHDSRHHP